MKKEQAEIRSKVTILQNNLFSLNFKANQASQNLNYLLLVFFVISLKKIQKKTQGLDTLKNQNLEVITFGF